MQPSWVYETLNIKNRTNLKLWTAQCIVPVYRVYEPLSVVPPYSSVTLERLRSIRRNVVALLSSILPDLDMQGISYDTIDVDSILQQIIQANNLWAFKRDSGSQAKHRTDRRPIALVHAKLSIKNVLYARLTLYFTHIHIIILKADEFS